MSLERAFRLSSILLAATSFASLALAMLLPGWLMVLGGSAFALALVRLWEGSLSRRLNQLRFSARTWNIFLLLAFAGFWVDVVWVSQELLRAGIHFLVTLLINKLFNLEQRRDFLHLYAISLMAILASAALTSHVWYAPIFMMYLLCAVWTLLLYHLTAEGENRTSEVAIQRHVALKPPPTGQIGARFFWTTNAMAAGAFCLTLAFFFAIPRIGIGYFQKGRGDSLRTTGFSDRVDLGLIGPVKHDPSIVMRVELADDTGGAGRLEPLYLRGVAYDRYNGKSWNNSLPHRRALTEFPQGTFSLRPLPSSAMQGHEQPVRIRQDVLLEALDTPVLFGAPLPVSVSADLLAVQSDLMGALYLPLPATTRIQYTVYSTPRPLLAADQTATAFLYPEFVRQHYLQVPHTSPQLVELARSITRSATSIAQAVSLVRTHLLSNYRYSLEIPMSESTQPLEEFLFERKSGYCEHYATAMVVLLRVVGIPARLVTGFLATEWNEFGNYYTVRQRDAHAWVEVYFPLSGWVTMDPTPSSPEPARSAWWQVTHSAIDSIRLKWDRLFVHYSANDQMALVQTVRESGDVMRVRMSESFSGWFVPLLEALGRTLATLQRMDLKQALLMGLVGLAGIASIIVLLQHGHVRNRVRPTSLSASQQLAISLYKDMLSCCTSHGIAKTPAATSIEFLEEIRSQWSDALSCTEPITHLYTRVRFGGAPLSAEEYDAAQQALRTLRTLARDPHRGTKV